MNKKIEVEKKYFCKDTKKLIDLIKLNGLKISEKQTEIDEYFTDINSEFIKNRTCLRLRKKANNLELTYKGKSKTLSSGYAKIEEDITLNINEYDNIISILKSLGYYSYVIAKKNRTTYTKKYKDYTLNIMIDNIENIGTFVEFELLYFKPTYSEKELLNKLEKFISNFKEIKLEEAHLPYRDFVAKEIYNKIKSVKAITITEEEIDPIKLKLLKDLKQMGIKIGVITKDKKIDTFDIITSKTSYIKNLKLKQNECLSLEDEKITNRILFILINHIKS